MPTQPDASPWVLVAGGFHRRGAMDLANLALAEHLLSEGREVHLVAHEVDLSLAARRGAHVHTVPRLGAVALGELMLERDARRVCTTLRKRSPNLHVLANGGNFASSDVNWVHSVHRAWPVDGSAAPIPFRLKRQIERRVFTRREGRAFARARLIVANSSRTERDLLEHFHVEPARVRVIRPGADPSWQPSTEQERRDARLQFNITGTAVLFVGALGADDNKGLGPVLEAWRVLCASRGWDGTLLVCGTGPLRATWQRQVERVGLGNRVRFLGFVPAVARMLSASDVLVSASRYESYGLAIAEALCRGIPAVMPAHVGIASSLGPGYEGLLVREATDADALADVLRRWAGDRPRWREVAAEEGARLREYTMADMAAAIVCSVEA